MPHDQLGVRAYEKQTVSYFLAALELFCHLNNYCEISIIAGLPNQILSYTIYILGWRGSAKHA